MLPLRLEDATMTRRIIGLIVSLTLGLLMAPLAVEAQGLPMRMGVLGPAEEPRFSEVVAGLQQGLRAQEARAQALEIVEARVTRGDRTGARVAVEGLIQQRVAVLFVIGSELARLAREVSSELPIVFMTPGDPVAAGVVASLAHPGGHMTAITFEYPELSGKRLELLKAMVPHLRRVLVLYDPRDASPRQSVTAAREAAAPLGITLVEREARSEEEIRQGLAALDEVDAFLGIPGGLTAGFSEEMIRAAHARRRPTIFHARTQTTMEALATYGTSDVSTARQAARLVEKILTGAQAGELPIERPMKLDLSLNLKTAQELGLTIPPTLLFQADEVIR
jgi:putative tryptophan/tyrosine transport system substrate-binding protein